jgi:rod shape-determining protein MreB
MFLPGLQQRVLVGGAPARFDSTGGFGVDLAIDLGTRSTQVYAPGRGIVLDEFSLAAVERERGRVIGAGWEAWRLLRDDSAGLEAVWPLMNGVVADFEVAEQMLSHFIRKARRRAQKGCLRPPQKPRVLVCVPAGATNLELSTARRVVVAAGGRDVRTVEAPLAAAVGAGLPVNETRGTMIVDIGGGKTEAAVLSLGKIVAGASVRCGGNTMDDAIRSYFRREHILSVDAREAERLKIELGSALTPGDNEEEFEEVCGVDLLSGSPKTILTNNKEIHGATTGCVDTVVEAVRATLESTPAELVSDIAEGGIVLCGNGAWLRLLEDLLHYKAGVPVSVAREPHKCVALGAGLILEGGEYRHESLSLGELRPDTSGGKRPPTLQSAVERWVRGK